jgi:hypothetical protein
VLAVLVAGILVKDSRSAKIADRMAMVMALIGIALLLTPLRGFGIAMLFGLGVNRMLTKSFYASLV